MSELKHVLAGCTGTTSYKRITYGHPLVITEGVELMAEKAGAFWLLTEVLFTLWPHYIAKQNESDGYSTFVVRIVVDENKHWVLSLLDENMEPVAQKKHGFTTFPEGSFSMYLSPSQIGEELVHVLYLFSER